MFALSSLTVNIINALLAREAWARKKLATHAGKIVRVYLGKSPLDVLISPEGTIESLKQTLSPAQTPHVSLRIPDTVFSQWSQYLTEKNGMQTLTEHLHIEGEAGLAKTLSELAQDLRWDIPAELTNLFGPLMADIMIKSIKKTMQWGHILGQKTMEQSKAFLSQDYHVTVQTALVQTLKNDIQDLQQRVNQLEKQLP